MAAKTTQPTVSTNDAEALDRIVASIVAARGTKNTVSLSTFLADKAADSTRGIARIGAGFAAGAENASLAFVAERERQTRRTAAAILAAARAA